MPVSLVLVLGSEKAKHFVSFINNPSESSIRFGKKRLYLAHNSGSTYSRRYEDDTDGTEAPPQKKKDLVHG